MTIPDAIVVPADVSLVETTIWTKSSEIAAELDSRCLREGSSRGICQGLRRQSQTVGVFCEDISFELEQVRHVWLSIHPLSSLKHGDYPVGQDCHLS